jgi:hypothetical protein
MRTFSFVVGLCIAALALGLPSADEVVPETTLFVTGQDDSASFEEAKQTVASMTAAGKTDKDCRKLATESKKEIKKTVGQSQKVLDALPSGADCTKAHDSTVGKAQSLKNKADQDAKDAKKAVDKSCDVKVDFGSFHLSGLKPGKCDQFYSKSAYTSAAKKCADAKKAKEKADGAKDEAAKSLKKTKEAAGKDKNKCLCKVKKAHKSAWADAIKSNDANAKAWAKAHHIECVLDATPASKCTVPACPAPKKPTIISAAKNAVCTFSEVAMIVNGGNTGLHYDSAYWTNSATGNLGNGNSKTSFFFEKAKKAIFTFKTGSQTRSISVDMGGKSLQQKFKAGTSYTSISKSTWTGLGGSYKFAYQNHCNRQGFDVTAKHGYKARFGMIFNEQNNCNSPDTMIGVGIQSKAKMSAGGYCGCCNQGGKCKKTGSTVTITVEGEK